MAASDEENDPVCARALVIVDETAQPFVDRGSATLEHVRLVVDQSEPGTAAARIRPSRNGAAEVMVDPGPHFTTLLVGPKGLSHEIVVDKQGEWESALRSCLLAVMGGGCSEEVIGGPANKVRLNFHLDDGCVITVNHYVLDGPRHRPTREHWFEPYE